MSEDVPMNPCRLTGPVSLSNCDPALTYGIEESFAISETERYRKRIGELQEVFYANANRGLILLFQGVDASGKDGAVKSVLEHVNPAGVETANFKAPSDEEKAHDFFWRIHKASPRFGNIGVFNRSHYEEVLIVRVMNFISEKVWRDRYEQINMFERILTSNGYIILKFFLHISKEEQGRRFRHRFNHPTKRWEFSRADLEMRAKWDDFELAFNDMLNNCHTTYAPWNLIPANTFWARDYWVSRIVAERMEALNLQWPKSREDLSGIEII